MKIKESKNLGFVFNMKLPSGNKNEIQKIKNFCKKKKISYFFIKFKTGGFQFIFNEKDIKKCSTSKNKKHIEGYAVYCIGYELIIQDLTQGNIIEFESYRDKNG